jgi:hypothetical protein
MRFSAFAGSLEAVFPTHHHLAVLDRELHPISALQTKTLTNFWRHRDSSSTTYSENRRHRYPFRIEEHRNSSLDRDNFLKP